MKDALFALCFSLLLGTPAAAQGVNAPWDTTKDLTALIEQAERLNPVLEQLTPQQWETKGAPATYTTQWRLARNEVGYLIGAARALQKQPEKLTLALETLFRLQAVEAQIIAKYQEKLYTLKTEEIKKIINSFASLSV